MEETKNEETAERRIDPIALEHGVKRIELFDLVSIGGDHVYSIGTVKDDERNGMVIKGDKAVDADGKATRVKMYEDVVVCGQAATVIGINTTDWGNGRVDITLKKARS